jgi:benzodiazapine receptor
MRSPSILLWRCQQNRQTRSTRHDVGSIPRARPHTSRSRMIHMYRDWISLLTFCGICFAVGASGSAFTASSVKTWYPLLLKPTGTPPPWVFGPVWSILYLLMATAAWLIWRQRIHENVWLALALFVVQLILNGLWSFVFFGLRMPGAALVEIIVLLGAIAVTAIRFAEFSRPAFWLMIPYGAWVLYASYLNFGIWRLNKGTS